MQLAVSRRLLHLAAMTTEMPSTVPLSRHPDRYPQAALVTGGAKRIGREISKTLAAEGWAIAIHHNRSGRAAEALAEEIRDDGGKAVAVRADLTDEAASQGLVAQAREALGPLGLLVNNAAVYELDRIDTATRQSWDFHLETNLRAPFVLTQSFAKALPDAAGGLVVNLLDERVWKPTPNFVTYTLSKSGLWTLTRTLAIALAPRIRVNGIGPGYALPEAGVTSADFEEAAAKMPLGRGTDPAEICAALRFLISTKSMTGQMIALDGGQHLGWQVPEGGSV